MRKTTKKLLAAVLSMAMVFTSFTGIGAVNDAKTASAAVSSVWKEDGYHAYLYIRQRHGITEIRLKQEKNILMCRPVVRM